MNRRALLAGVGALALAGCSVNIAVELPKIQIDASRLTAWIVAKFNGWAPALVKAVQAGNAKLQTMTPAGGWGPIVREVLTGFIKAAQMILSAASTILPLLGIPATVLALAGKVVSALAAFSNLAGAAGDAPRLADTDAMLAVLEAN